MMNFQIKKFKFKSGEEIVLRQTEDGKHVCPVCGFIGEGEPPYADTQALVNNQLVGPVFAGASFDICPICHTHYGCTDHPLNDEPQSVNWKWQQLRHAWLRRVVISKDVKMQLRNLGLDPDEQIRNALGNKSRHG
jgi:hypothetical protein